MRTEVQLNETVVRAVRNKDYIGEKLMLKRKQKLEATARAVKHLNTIKVAARNGAGATPNKAKVYAA